MTMLDHATRAYLRARIAVVQRAKQHAFDIQECGGSCAGCGAPWNRPTRGCKTCIDRGYAQRKRRTSPRNAGGHLTEGQDTSDAQEPSS